MNFDRLAIGEKAFRLEIINPKTGDVMRCKEGKPAFVDIHPIESEAADKWRRLAFERANRSGRGAGKKASYDESQASNVELLVSISSGWRIVDFDGNVIDEDYTPAKARELYGNTRMGWLTRQVSEGASEEANFIAA